MFVLLLIAFILVGLWLYPLTFSLKLVDGRWRLVWLPKVFLGYAPPQGATHGAREVEVDTRSLRFPVRFWWQLLRRVRLNWLDFLIIPGYRRCSCIFVLSCGDIIRSIIIAQARRRKNYARIQRRSARY